MKMTVAKIDEKELKELANFLTKLGDKVKEEAFTDEKDKDTNAKIGMWVRKKFPSREAFVAMLNLDILLRNYQDKDGDTLQHPTWITDMIGLIEDIGTIIEQSGSIHIEKGSMMDERIKKILKEEE